MSSENVSGVPAAMQLAHDTLDQMIAENLAADRSFASRSVAGLITVQAAEAREAIGAEPRQRSNGATDHDDETGNVA